MLKKLLFITVLIAGIASGINAENIKIEQLTFGKWLCKDPCINTNQPADSNSTKNKTIHCDFQGMAEHFKCLTFKVDNTFELELNQMTLTGKYVIDGEKITMNFDNYNKLQQKSRQTRENQTDRKSSKFQHSKKIIALSGTFDKDGNLKLRDNSTGCECTLKNYSETTAGFFSFYKFTGFPNAKSKNFIMILIGLIIIFLAIRYEFEPLMLVPVAIGILFGNIPFFQISGLNMQIGIFEDGSLLNLFYQGVINNWYVPLIFLGIGAMTDFSSLISNPKLMLLGIAAQFGIFAAFIGALYFGFAPTEAGAIGIIGGGDGPTSVFLASKLTNGINSTGFDPSGAAIIVKNLIAPIAISAYLFMAFARVIQPPVIRAMTNKQDRLIKMRHPRSVSKFEKILFPIVGLLVTLFIAPSAIPLLGMLFFGNLLRESGVTKRLSATASNVLYDIAIILLGISIGALAQADIILTVSTLKIFIIGLVSFIIATALGILSAKFLNLFGSKSNPINPIIGAAGVATLPISAEIAQEEGLKADSTNHLLTHAMAPNIAGIIGSAVVAGMLLSYWMF